MNASTVFESKVATFFEDIFAMRDVHRLSSWESDPILETPMKFCEKSDDKSLDFDEYENEVPTRSKIQKTTKSFVNDFIAYLVMILPPPFRKLLHLLTRTTGRKLFKARWIPS
jgi:hypothetical protein